MPRLALVGLLLLLVLWMIGGPVAFVPLIPAGFLILYISKGFFGAFISPWSVYMSAWLVMLLLYLPPVFFLPELRMETYFAIILSSFTFSAGSFWGYRRAHINGFSTRANSSEFSSIVSPRQVLSFAGILMLVGLVGVALTWRTISSVTQIFSLQDAMGNLGTINDTVLDRDFGSFGIAGRLSVLPILAAVLALIGGMLYLQHLHKRDERMHRRPVLLYGPILFALVTFVVSITVNTLNTRRGGVVLLLAWSSLVLLFYVERQRGLRASSLLIIGSIVVVFSLLFSMTQTYLGKDAIIRFPVYVLDLQLPGWLVDQAFYINGNLATLQGYLTQAPDWSFGARTFDVFYLALQRFLPGQMQSFSRSVEPIFLSFHYNTSPYLWYVYQDWGWFGIVLFPILVGWVGSNLFARFQRDRSPIGSLLMCGLFSTALALTIRGNMFGQYDFWTLLLAVFLSSRILERPAPRAINPQQ